MVDLTRMYSLLSNQFDIDFITLSADFSLFCENYKIIRISDEDKTS